MEHGTGRLGEEPKTLGAIGDIRLARSLGVWAPHSAARAEVAAAGALTAPGGDDQALEEEVEQEATAEEKAAYAMPQRDNVGKDKFRLNWAKTKYEGLQQKVKEKSQTWQIVDEEVGEYMSISKSLP